MNRSVPLAPAALVAWAVLLAAVALAANDPKPAPPGKIHVRRVGVFIGVQEYESKRIRNLRAPKRDAIRMEEELKAACGLALTHVLTNKDATLDAIADVFTQKVPAQTRPGDEVVVYWSGHGLQLPLDPKANPPVRLFLIPHNGDPSTVASVKRTMVADATFHDWIVRSLEGRRVVLILDTCHSGGATLSRADGSAAEVKAVSPPPGLSARTADKAANFPEHFLAGPARGVRSPGGGLWVLASSRADQPSFELPKGEHGVMTHFLLDALATEKKGQPLTVGELAEVLKKRVPDFVQEKGYPGPQNPVFDGPSQPIPLIRR